MTKARTPAEAAVKVPEAAVQNYIDAVCQYRTVAHCHTKDSRGSQRGFLDSTCIGAGGVRIFEAKDDDGATTDEQKLWTWLWESVGVRVVLVRPEDMQPRADLGGKSLIQHEIDQIATGPDGRKFPPHIVEAIKRSRSAQQREMAKAIARRQARRR